MKNKVIIFMICTFILSGCSNINEVNSKENIKFKDGLNREITLSKEADKLLVYSPLVNFVCALGGSDKILEVGNSKSLESDLINKIIPNVQKLYPKIDITKGVNVEHVASLNPDLIIVPGKQKGDLEILEKAGFKVFVLVGENIDQILDSIKNLSIAIGKEEKGEELINYYNDSLKEIKNKVLENKEKPTVYFAGTDFLTTSSKNMLQGDIIDFAGGKSVSENIEGSSWVKVSPEQILSWDPDIILIPQYKNSIIKKDDIINNPKWKSLKAVKNGKVYSFPSNIIPWDYPSVQTILGIKWLAKVIGGDNLKSLDINKESEEFFKNYFKIGFNEIGGKLN